MQRSDQETFSHSNCFPGNIINKAKRFKPNTSKFIKSLKNLIHKGHELASAVDFLRQLIFFA